MDKRLIKLLLTKGNEIRGGQMLDTYNQQIQQDVSCTIRTNINTANHHFIVMENISNTLTSEQKDNYLDTGCQQGGGVNENWKSVVGNKQMNPFRGSIDGESPCITSACGAGGGMTPTITDADIETTKSKEFIEQMRGHEKMQYRIRKLTPTEVFRLMGVDDADIDKIQAAGISNAQQYKMAGNSIVVDVLYYLFKQMFVESENNQKGQLTLF